MSNELSQLSRTFPWSFSSDAEWGWFICSIVCVSSPRPTVGIRPETHLSGQSQIFPSETPRSSPSTGLSPVDLRVITRSPNSEGDKWGVLFLSKLRGPGKGSLVLYRSRTPIGLRQVSMGMVEVKPESPVEKEERHEKFYFWIKRSHFHNILTRYLKFIMSLHFLSLKGNKLRRARGFIGFQLLNLYIGLKKERYKYI